jgi:hypothetical protein
MSVMVRIPKNSVLVLDLQLLLFTSVLDLCSYLQISEL